MADPITIAILAGGGLIAGSQVQEGRIAKAQGSFANKIALRNQQALEKQAKAEMEASRLEERRIARKQKFLEARQIASMGKSGIGLAGASLEDLTDTAFQFSLDRNLTLRTGMIRAGQLRERGKIMAAEGKWSKAMGRQTQRLSYVKAGATILSSIALAGQYSALKAAGNAGTATNEAAATLIKY